MNNTGKELNVNKIHRANNKKNNNNRSYLDNKFISILLKALI